MCNLNVWCQKEAYMRRGALRRFIRKHQSCDGYWLGPEGAMLHNFTNELSDAEPEEEPFFPQITLLIANISILQHDWTFYVYELF